MDEADKQRIKDEEYFRDQVRKELAGNKKPSSLELLFQPDNAKWIATTFLIPVLTIGYANLDRYLHRDQLNAIADQAHAAADRAQAGADLDQIVRLLPELYGTPQQKNNAVLLMTYMHDNTIASQAAKKLLDQIGDNTQRFDLNSHNVDTRVAGAKTIEILANAASPHLVDPAAAAAATTAKTTLEKGVLSPTASAPLQLKPARVYIQIYRTPQQADAAKVQAALRGYGIPVPAIDNIAHDHGPGTIKGAQKDTIDIRFYYAADKGAAENVAKIVNGATALGYTTTMRDLSSWPAGKKAAPGIVEIWYPCSSGKDACAL